jgi:four helix bundle protein
MSDDIRDFRDLLIWRKAITLAKEVYEITRRFPPSERYGLTAQVRRAAVSVSSNIAEGHARRGREFVHFLSVARGSLAEVESQLTLGVELGYLDTGDVEPIASLATEIRRMSAATTRKLTPP